MMQETKAQGVRELSHLVGKTDTDQNLPLLSVGLGCFPAVS